MIVKDMYQSGITVLIDGFKALMEEAKNEDLINYGAKANAMFDHCQITFLVSDVRGVEIITLKSLATVKVLTESPFTSPKKLRPTIFSNEYPNVTNTEEYKRFIESISRVNQKNISFLEEASKEYRNIPEIYKYNFAGSVAFDALVTFSGSNLTQLIGVFPAQSLRNKDGSWIDPDGQYFINKAVASFKKIYYEALEGIFGTVDMQTDVALEKMYFTKLWDRNMLDLDVKNSRLTNVFYAMATHPMGSIDLISSTKPRSADEIAKYTKKIYERMSYLDNAVNGTNSRSFFASTGEFLDDFLIENTTFIIYARCSIQTLLMLYAYTNIVSYYTDLKNVLGVQKAPNPVPTEYSDTIMDLVKEVETEKSEVLNILKKYNAERSYYEENRYKNTKLRPPKSMIQRKEYYNMVPLYSEVCCVLKFTKKDWEKLTLREIPVTEEFISILAAMKKFIMTAQNQYRTYANLRVEDVSSNSSK